MNLLGNDVNVVIERKRIKNIYFRINNSGDVLVTCSRFVPNFEINMLLNKNKEKIEKMYAKYLKNLVKDNYVFFLGNKLEFVYDKKIHLDESCAYGPSIVAINDFLEKNCLPIFNKRLNIYINEFDNLPKFRLRTRKMKTRWGVCNKSSMTVTLNTLLIHKSIFEIDYVICHELSHFNHMDHSKAFWNEVEKPFPEYKKARKELKD